MCDGLGWLTISPQQGFGTHPFDERIEWMPGSSGQLVDVLGVVRKVFAVLFQVQGREGAHMSGAETVNERFEACTDLGNLLDADLLLGRPLFLVLQIFFDQAPNGF